MTTPVILDVTTSGNNTAGDPWSVSHPAYNSGDLIVICTGNDDSTNITTVAAPSGPNGETINTIVHQAIGGDATPDQRASAFWYVATSTESAGSLSFNPNATESWGAVCFRVAAGDFDSADPIGNFADGGNATDSATSDSPAFSAGADDGGGRLVVWGCIDVQNLSAAGAATSGWTNLDNRDIGALGVFLSYRDTAVTDSESISSTGFDLSGANVDTSSTIAFIIRESTVVTHEGSGTPSLPLLTASGTGTKTRKGTGTPSLPILTASGAGKKTRKGSGTPSLPILTASGVGDSTPATTTHEGSGTPSLPLLTASGAGKKTRKGTGTPSLPILTASGAGKKARAGTGAVSLPILTADGVGTKTRKGSGTPSLPLLTADGSASVAGVHACSGDVTLPLFTASGVASGETQAVEQPVTGGGYPLEARRRQILRGRRKKEKEELEEEIRLLEEHLGIEPDVSSDIQRIRALVEEYRRESEAVLSNRARRAFNYAERARTEQAWKLAYREYQKALEQEELNLILSIALD